MIANPVNKRVEKRIANRMVRYVVQLLIDAAILICLCGLSSLFSFNLYR